MTKSKTKIVSISMSEKKHKELKKKAIDMDTTLSDYLVQSAATVSRTKLDLSSDK